MKTSFRSFRRKSTHVNSQKKTFFFHRCNNGSMLLRTQYNHNSLLSGRSLSEFSGKRKALFTIFLQLPRVCNVYVWFRRRFEKLRHFYFIIHFHLICVDFKIGIRQTSQRQRLKETRAREKGQRFLIVILLYRPWDGFVCAFFGLMIHGMILWI